MNSPIAKYFGISLEDLIFIGLGLILIAAAAFSFRSGQTFVKEFTRSAVKAAAEG
jgi:hypothetical protein